MSYEARRVRALVRKQRPVGDGELPKKNVYGAEAYTTIQVNDYEGYKNHPWGNSPQVIGFRRNEISA